MKYQKGYANGGVLLPYTLGLWVIAAWLTHVITCLTTGAWGFLIAGAIVFPVAVVHGTGIWFGAW